MVVVVVVVVQALSIVMFWAGPQALSPLSQPVQARAKPGPDEGFATGSAWLQILEAQAWGSSPGFDILQSGAQMHDWINIAYCV